MQESIRRINNQQYTKETGKLVFSRPRLELSVSKDGNVTGSVEVSCQDGQDFTGYVYSSDYRMQCKRRKLIGGKAILEYQFDASGMEFGDVRKGEICVVTGFGQFFLPYQAEIAKPVIHSSLGPVKNLFHFVNLAKMHWEEAVPIFYSDAFADILVGVDRQYLPAYIGLSKYKNNEHNMEEFLLLTNKKQPQTFALEETEAVFDTLMQERTGTLRVERNGWGYTRIAVSVSGDFIHVAKHVLTEEDFVANRCSIPFEILEKKLHDGTNYGRIVLRCRDQSLMFDVTVGTGRAAGRKAAYERGKRVLMLHVMQEYLDFRTGRKERQQWLTASEEYVAQMTKQHTGSILARLYQAHILLLTERSNEAKWILKHISQLLEQGQGDDGEYAYYLYLTYLYDSEDETGRGAFAQLRGLYREASDDFRFYWLLLQSDGRMMADAAQMYRELERLFLGGCHSPVLYLEAYRLVEREPKLLCRLGSFEVQFLRFAVKYEILAEELFDQLSRLASRTKERERDVLPILEYGYGRYGTDSILQAICSLLIQNGGTDPRSFGYFQKAVERGLRLTRLYEYYMLSLDPDKGTPLPKEVLLFYSYECHLDYEKKAYVFACACRQREEIESAFASIEQQIPEFIKEQIRNGRLNKDLAFLYEKYLGTLEFDGELASQFAKLAFKYRIEVGRTDIRNVIVVHEQLKKERVYPVAGQTAYASVYTDGFCVLFEDADGNRFVPREKLTLDPILLYQKLSYLLENLKPDHIGFWLYICESKKTYAMVDGENIHAFTNLILNPEVWASYKQQFGKRVLKYYFEHDYMDELKNLVEHLNYANVAAQDRDDVVRYMLLLKRYDLAYEFVMNFGFDQLEARTLQSICVHQLENVEGLSMPALWLCYEVFKRGRKPEPVLSYLAEHFEGTLRQMKDIWIEAKKLELKTTPLEARILTQLLFCDGFLAQKEEIFESYARHAAGVDPLMRAYIAKNCYDYFVRDYLTGEKLFAELLQFLYQKEPLVLVCKLAFLKYFAGLKEANGQISLEEKAIITDFLSELIEKEYFFSFFLVFREWVPFMLPEVERTYVEYRTQPGAKVTIHYLVAKDGKAVTDYTKEPMMEVYDGYYCKSFYLFFSKQLQYYITIDEDGRENLVESGSVEKLDITDVNKETRFSLLNDILVAGALQDQDTTALLMREYAEKVWMAEEFFGLK